MRSHKIWNKTDTVRAPKLSKKHLLLGAAKALKNSHAECLKTDHRQDFKLRTLIWKKRSGHARQVWTLWFIHNGGEMIKKSTKAIIEETKSTSPSALSQLMHTRLESTSQWQNTTKTHLIEGCARSTMNIKNITIPWLTNILKIAQIICRQANRCRTSRMLTLEWRMSLQLEATFQVSKTSQWVMMVLPAKLSSDATAAEKTTTVAVLSLAMRCMEMQLLKTGQASVAERI